MTLKIIFKSMFKFVISFLLISIMTFSANATCVFNCPKTENISSDVTEDKKGKGTLKISLI